MLWNVTSFISDSSDACLRKATNSTKHYHKRDESARFQVPSPARGEG